MLDLTKRDPVADTTRAATDTADLVKKGLVTNLTLTDGSAPSATPEAVAKDAELLHTALTNKRLGLWSNPDAAAVERILDPKNAKDRTAVEAKYQETYGTKLRDDVKTYLGGDGVNFRTVEAMLNRTDSRTNFGGNLEVAIETAKVDPEKGNRLMRSAVGSLNSDQISQMATDLVKGRWRKGSNGFSSSQRHRTATPRIDPRLGHTATSGRKPANEQEKAAYNAYQKAYVDHVISETPGLTDANRQVLGIMTKGVNHRSPEDIEKMAHVALGAGDLKMFADSVNGDTPAAIAARKQLFGDAAFVKQFNDKFVSNANQTQADVAKDLLTEGKVSIATIIKRRLQHSLRLDRQSQEHRPGSFQLNTKRAERFRSRKRTFHQWTHTSQRTRSGCSCLLQENRSTQ